MGLGGYVVRALLESMGIVQLTGMSSRPSSLADDQFCTHQSPSDNLLVTVQRFALGALLGRNAVKRIAHVRTNIRVD